MDLEDLEKAIEGLVHDTSLTPREKRGRLSQLIESFSPFLWDEWKRWLRHYIDKKLIEKNALEVWEEVQKSNLERLKRIRDVYFWMMLDIIYAEKTDYIRQLEDNQILGL